MHRIGVALVGRRLVEPARLVEVLGDAVALFVERAEPEHRGREAAASGTFIPDGGFGEILRHAAAVSEAVCDLVSGRRLARRRSVEQLPAEPFGRPGHLEIEAGIGGRRGRMHRTPIGHDHAVIAPLFLEDVGEQGAIFRRVGAVELVS